MARVCLRCDRCFPEELKLRWECKSETPQQGCWRYLKEHHLTPMARFVGWSAAGRIRFAWALWPRSRSGALDASHRTEFGRYGVD